MCVSTSARGLDILSQLALGQDASEAAGGVAAMDDKQRAVFGTLAYEHHVVLRALRPLRDAAFRNQMGELVDWATQELAKEQSRIANALEFLEQICLQLEAAGCPITVMKSLDHWPDIGNDLDLYTTAGYEVTSQLLKEEFQAVRLSPTWGDRLANKRSFHIPGLKATVEIHHGRLGQTGEHLALARRFVERRVPVCLSGHTFMVPAPEEKIIAATLQRMYRHMYFRICDIANSGGIAESGALDYTELRAAADCGGIWPGVASYLKIVSDYWQRYRGTQLPLPNAVTDAALLDGDAIFVRGPWLRIPVFPRVLSLYGRQMAAMAAQGDVRGTFRLSLLPPLASVAQFAYRMTGNPSGIW